MAKEIIQLAEVGPRMKPSIPSLDPRLAAYMRDGLETGAITDENPVGLYFRAGWQPEPISPAGQALIAATIERFRHYLAPAEPKWLTIRLASFRSHFAIARNPFADQVGEDWDRLLGDYPDWAISEAIDEFLRWSRYAPTISDIAVPCAQAVREARLQLKVLEHALEHAAIEFEQPA